MFQSDHITRVAEVVFKEEGRIKISGQGMLKKVFLSAYLSEDGQNVLPPREHFYFNRNKHMELDTTLVRKVSTYFILSDEEAEDLVRSWERLVLKRAAEEGLVFGDYGTFHFDDQLDFVAETLLYYQLLPPVQYISVGSNLHEYPTKEVKSMAPVATVAAPNKRKVLMPVLWTLLICLFGFAFFLWSGPLDVLIGQNIEFNKRLVNVAPESYSTDVNPEVYNDTDEMSMDAHAIKKAKPDPADKVVPTGSESKNIRPSSDNEISKAEGSQPPVSDHSREAGGSSVPLDESNAISPRCTLIVGAFAEAGNVDRMVQRLRDMEVEVVTMERTTLTLVGANISCNNSTTINTLRAQIDSNAWIYKK